jgi:hypothetical protein
VLQGRENQIPAGFGKGEMPSDKQINSKILRLKHNAYCKAKKNRQHSEAAIDR